MTEEADLKNKKPSVEDDLRSSIRWLHNAHVKIEDLKSDYFNFKAVLSGIDRLIAIAEYLLENDFTGDNRDIAIAKRARLTLSTSKRHIRELMFSYSRNLDSDKILFVAETYSASLRSFEFACQSKLKERFGDFSFYSDGYLNKQDYIDRIVGAIISGINQYAKNNTDKTGLLREIFDNCSAQIGISSVKNTISSESMGVLHQNSKSITKSGKARAPKPIPGVDLPVSAPEGELYANRSDKKESAPHFIERVYGQWLTGQFTRARLRYIDEQAEMGLRNWEKLHGKSALNLPKISEVNDRYVASGEIVTDDPKETARRAAAAVYRQERKPKF